MTKYQVPVSNRISTFSSRTKDISFTLSIAERYKFSSIVTTNVHITIPNPPAKNLPKLHLPASPFPAALPQSEVESEVTCSSVQILFKHSDGLSQTSTDRNVYQEAALKPRQTIPRATLFGGSTIRPAVENIGVNLVDSAGSMRR